MNDQQRAAMQMALEALDNEAEYLSNSFPIDADKAESAIAALREALRNASERMAQPQGEWVDLTDDEIVSEFNKSRNNFDYASAVIAAFKEKNK